MSKSAKPKKTELEKAADISAKAWKALQEQHIGFARENTEAYLDAAEAALGVKELSDLSQISEDYHSTAFSRHIDQIEAASELLIKAHQDTAKVFGIKLPKTFEAAV